MRFSRLYAFVGGYFRRRRIQWVLTEFRGCESVVDLGGTAESWPGHGFSHLTLVNVTASDHLLPEGACYVRADACQVPLHSTFDLAYSNSVIEHVGSWERQRQFAGEMTRLGRRIYCQTPNRWFPIEPHYLTAFVHWLPSRMFGHTIHRWLTLQGLSRRPSRSESLVIRQRNRFVC